MSGRRTIRVLGLATAGVLATALGGGRMESAAGPAPTLPLARQTGFAENRGQVDGRVRFLSRGPRDTLFLTTDEAVLAPKGTGRPVIRMRLTDANANAELRGVDPFASLTYYARSESRGPLEPVRTYRRIRSANVYPGIDLEYYRSGPAIEFDVYLAPGADSRRIELTFPGTDQITRDADGHLILHAGGEPVVMRRPLAFQEDDHGRQAVPVDYVVSGDRVRFALGDYDHTRALTIDPTIEFATYLGGPGDDEVVDAQLDNDGNVYVFGRTNDGPAFPQTDLVPAQQTIDPINCFVSKISADGNALEYSVVFEGFGICEAFEVDGTQGAVPQVHVAMQSQLGNYGGFAQLRTLDFGVPVLVSPLKHGELSQIAGRPTQIEDIRTDGFGNTYILYHQLVQGDAELQARLIKVNAYGNIVGTHDIGAPSQAAPSARGIAADNFGRVFVAGSTSGAITPSPDAFQSTRPTLFNCPENGFLIRVDTSVEPWVETYATYIAGNGCDIVTGIVRGPLGSIYLTGRSGSDDLPMIGERWTGGAGGDGIMLRFDVSPQGDVAFGAGRFLGLGLGSGGHEPRHPIVQLPSGEMALTGGATGASLPLTVPLYDASAAPGFPRFLQVLSPLTLLEIFATHLDSSGAATNAVAAAPRGSGLWVASPHVFAVTETPESGLGTSGVQPNLAGGQDLLIRRIDLLDVLTNTPPVFELGEHRSIQAADASGADFDLQCPACGIVDYDGLVSQMIWTIDGVRYVIGEPFVGQVTLPVGIHFIELVVTDTSGAATVDTLILTVDPPNTNQPPVANAGPDQEVVSQGGGELVHLDGRASTDPEGDPLTFTWAENGTPIGSGAEIDVALPPGTHPITLTVTDTAGNSSSDTVVVTVIVETNETDLSLSVSTPSAVVPGPNDVTLTVTLTNLGPADTLAPRINATLGPGLQFVSDDGAGACEWPAGVCAFGNTPVGTSRTVHVVVRPAGIGTVTATFVASGPLNDPVPANNSGTITIQAGILISEMVHVTDTALPSPALVLPVVNEAIHVSDTATPAAGSTPVTSGGTEYQAASADGTPQPVYVTFSDIQQIGFLFAEAMASPPPPPIGTALIALVMDVTTTALYTGPVTVCLSGAFLPGDRLLHFEGGAWVDITIAAGFSDTRLCGQTMSLSPFAAVRIGNRPPTVDAGVYPPAEATSPAGATIMLSGTATDPDAGDTLSFAWTEAGLLLGTTPTLSHTFSLGVHTVTLTVTDRTGASASATAMVAVTDTTPPSVTPPPPLSIPATRAEGTRVSEWPALVAWLTAATAVDMVDAAPARQMATLNGSPIGPDSPLPLGQSTVTFPFRDASGNLGAATAIVRVAVGTPRVEVRLVGTGSLGGKQRYVDLAFANGGDGIARRATTLVVPVTTRGSGVTRLLTQLPITIGDIVPGQSQTVRVVLQVPSTVREFRLVEAGAFVTVDGRVGGFADSQVVRP